MSSISSLDRALDILNIMYENGGKIGVSELTRIMGLHKSTVYRTLNTLYLKDFLYKDNAGVYALGPRVFTMGLVAATNIPLAKTSKPYLAYLSNKYETRASIFIIEREFDEKQENKCVFCLNQFLDTESSLLLSTPSQCETSEAYRPAVGMCIAAYNNQGPMNTDNEFIMDSWRKLSKKIIKKNFTIDNFIKNLEEIKSSGYAYENEIFISGQISIASPIINSANKATATISIDGDKRNLLKKFSLEEMVSDIKKSALSINNEWQK